MYTIKLMVFLNLFIYFFGVSWGGGVKVFKMFTGIYDVFHVTLQILCLLLKKHSIWGFFYLIKIIYIKMYLICVLFQVILFNYS